ncbi:MAG: hypothetical protein JW919_07410 [Candidatus Omnitrophica bacterium]|nr:hypothetical protein [Candidatus Omnitrophota bacterium]
MQMAKGTASLATGAEFGIADVLRLLTSVTLLRRQGFLLHASAVLRKGHAYVFFGPSESGKTTVARLSGEDKILTDETAAIALSGNAYYAYATPFAGEFEKVSENTGGPIRALMLLRKDDKFAHRALSRKEAVQELFRSVIMPPADIRTFNAVFAALDALAAGVPCYEFHFKAEPELWRYIDGSIA